MPAPGQTNVTILVAAISTASTLRKVSRRVNGDADILESMPISETDDDADIPYKS